MFEIIGLAAAGAASVGGFAGTRRFVRDRLRYVDAAHSGKAPWIAGVVAALIAMPVVALLPIVGAGTAIVFGIAVGYGVHKGTRDTKGSRGEVMVI